MSKLLIDAGRSSRGWSRIGTFFRCPQLFAYGERLNLEMIPADALTRGSMGHVMQAHLHATYGAKQGGCWVDDKWVDDPDMLMTPQEAVQAYCDANGGHEFIDRMIETFENYIYQFPESPGRILSVEHQVTAVLGEKEGVWGLWVVHPEDQDFAPDVAKVRACDDGIIRPSPLNVPGHPDHGHAVSLTRRMDMSTRDKAGRAYVWDHKHQAQVRPGRSVDAYAIDGGFAAFRIMGRQLYGTSVGGVTLNLIQTTPPWRVARPAVPPTPHRDMHFAEMLWRAEHQLARLDLEATDHWSGPKVQNESTCVGRYGSCAGIKLCFYGEAGKY